MDLTVKICNAPDKAWSPCIQTKEGHSTGVSSVAFSHDDARIVSGSYDHTIRLWDAVSGTHLNTLEGHSRLVTSVAFSRDDARIVSASYDQTVWLWDAVSGAHLNTLCGHSSSVLSVAFSRDDARIVSASYDRTIRLWDAVSGAHLNTLKGHSDSVTSVAFSHDGARIVSGSNDRTIRLCAHLKILEGHSGSVKSVAFSHDDTRIVSGSIGGTVHLWDAISGVLLNTLEANPVFVHSIAQSCSSSHNLFSQTLTDVSHSMCPIFGYMMNHGWVQSITHACRILWIPVSCRPNALATMGDRVAFGTPDGGVIIIDFTGMGFYLRNL
jgi:WD40 repeat protein